MTNPKDARDDLVARLRASAKLLRASSQGFVGDKRHWMKDCATDCDNGADALVQAQAMQTAYEKLEKSARAISENFKKDIEQGLQSRDRTYVIEMLAPYLALLDTKPQETGK